MTPRLPPPGLLSRSSELTTPRPMIGGAFANAAQKYPSLFGYDFLRQYPYFMPCFVTGSLGLLGFVLGWFSLEEVCVRVRDARIGADDGSVPHRPCQRSVR